MADIVRIAAIGGTVGALVAGSLAAPSFFQSAVAEEPVKAASAAFADILPHRPFDPSGLVKFDVILGPGVSTDVQHSSVVAKISYGHREYVSIITTPTGTYSSDALTSPNVRYPGIDLVPEFEGHWGLPYRLLGGKWTSTTEGSITTFTFVPANSTQS